MATWDALKAWRQTIPRFKESVYRGNSSPIWTIITLTIPGREEKLAKLKAEVAFQTGLLPVEHLVHSGPGLYGEEMRRSLEEASGRLVSWLDDDDFIAPGYVSKIAAAAETHKPEWNYEPPDAVTFGDACPGGHPAWFRTNREDRSQKPGEIPSGELMMANHFCVWRRDWALTVPWLPRSYGMEWVWMWYMNHLYHHHEIHIPEVLYIYNYDAKDTKCQSRAGIDESLSDGGGHLLLYRHMDGRFLVGKAKYPDGPYYAAEGKYVQANVKDMTFIREVVFK